MNISAVLLSLLGNRIYTVAFSLVLGLMLRDQRSHYLFEYTVPSLETWATQKSIMKGIMGFTVNIKRL